jgi:hypothetical protein
MKRKLEQIQQPNKRRKTDNLIRAAVTANEKFIEKYRKRIHEIIASTPELKPDEVLVKLAGYYTNKIKEKSHGYNLHNQPAHNLYHDLFSSLAACETNSKYFPIEILKQFLQANSNSIKFTEDGFALWVAFFYYYEKLFDYASIQSLYFKQLLAATQFYKAHHNKNLLLQLLSIEPWNTPSFDPDDDHMQKIFETGIVRSLELIPREFYQELTDQIIEVLLKSLSQTTSFRTPTTLLLSETLVYLVNLATQTQRETLINQLLAKLDPSALLTFFLQQEPNLAPLVENYAAKDWTQVLNCLPQYPQAHDFMNEGDYSKALLILEKISPYITTKLLHNWSSYNEKISQLLCQVFSDLAKFIAQTAIAEKVTNHLLYFVENTLNYDKTLLLTALFPFAKFIPITRLAPIKANLLVNCQEEDQIQQKMELLIQWRPFLLCTDIDAAIEELLLDYLESNNSLSYVYKKIDKWLGELSSDNLVKFTEALMEELSNQQFLHCCKDGFLPNLAKLLPASKWGSIINELVLELKKPMSFSQWPACNQLAKLVEFIPVALIEPVISALFICLQSPEINVKFSAYQALAKLIEQVKLASRSSDASLVEFDNFRLDQLKQALLPSNWIDNRQNLAARYELYGSTVFYGLLTILPELAKSISARQWANIIDELLDGLTHVNVEVQKKAYQLLNNEQLISALSPTQTAKIAHGLQAYILNCITNDKISRLQIKDASYANMPLYAARFLTLEQLTLAVDKILANLQQDHLKLEVSLFCATIFPYLLPEHQEKLIKGLWNCWKAEDTIEIEITQMLMGLYKFMSAANRRHLIELVRVALIKHNEIFPSKSWEQLFNEMTLQDKILLHISLLNKPLDLQNSSKVLLFMQNLKAHIEKEQAVADLFNGNDKNHDISRHIQAYDTYLELDNSINIKEVYACTI